MSLFSAAQREQIDLVAKKSNQNLTPTKSSSKSNRSITATIRELESVVEDYFKDSESILITTPDQLHDYVTELIKVGYAGIDTETTGLNVVKDTIVGASLYYPGGVECYIPIKHLVPIFDVPAKDQLTYEQVHSEFQRIADEGVRLIFANADFDLAMIFKDIKVDFNNNMYADVLSIWRCLKENELDNSLKCLYNKYVLGGKGDPKKFSDFFRPDLFPYCRPTVAKLYAANDAKITYLLFLFELPFITVTDDKCIRNHLEQIADLVWQIEMPMVKVCQNLHRTGVYVDPETCRRLKNRYSEAYVKETKKLGQMVQEILDTHPVKFTKIGAKRPFTRGDEFNGNSSTHVVHLFRDVMQLPKFQNGNVSADKDVLSELNIPVADQILKMRGIQKLVSTYVDKLPDVTTSDGRIHARFKSLGADTGRMSSYEPNLQNIPSHATDIRHMFRATPEIRYELNCEEHDGTLSIQLPNYYIVNTPDGEVKVHDLTEGCSVTLTHDTQQQNLTLRSISYIENSPDMLLVFELGDDS